MVCAVVLFGVYMNSARANGQATPCDGGTGDQGTLWKWGYCHQGHGICTGDATEVDRETGHIEHGVDKEGNPPKGCFFMGCCNGNDDSIKCDDPKSGGK
jgi:hypothetical protein